MTKLEHLIQELCPDGVDFKRIGECCRIEKGKTPIQKATPGEYPLVVTTSERKTSNTYQFEEPTVCIPLVSSRGHGVASLNEIYYQDGKFALGNILCGITPLSHKQLSAKFLCKYLNHKKDVLIVPLMRGGANVSLSADSLKRIRIPVPPLEVQAEIVRILDTFTELTTELTTELANRKKQYEYYRDKFLRFESTVNKSQIGDLCNIIVGGDVPKEHYSKEKSDAFSVPIISNGIGENAIYGYTNKVKVNQSAVTIAARGTIGYAEFRDYPYYPIIRLLSLIPKNNSIINTKYLYYCLQGRKYKIPKTGIPQLTVPMLKKEKICVPSLETQNHIVSVLDRFDALCNNISKGLPAEIEARQKQYEYYRDKLLQFAIRN